MPAIVLGILAAMFLLGVVVVCLAWRGRRINRHPVCGWCRFDLEGVYPGATTCPECGGGLLKAGKVRTGVRKRMPIVGLVGVAMVLLPLGVMGTVLYAALTSTDLNRYKPVGLLEIEANLSSSRYAERIARELLRRAETAAIDDGRLLDLARQIMRWQRDPDFRWFNEYGDVVLIAHQRALLSDDELDFFYLHSIDLDVRTRNAIRSEDGLPIVVYPKNLRAATRTEETLKVNVQLESIDGQSRADIGRSKTARGMGGFSTVHAVDVSSRYPVRRYGPMEIGRVGLLRLPGDIPPGTHRLALRCTVESSGTHRQPTSPDEPLLDEGALRLSRTVGVDVKVLPNDQPDVVPLKPDAGSERIIRDSIRVTHAVISPNEAMRARGWETPGMTLNIDVRLGESQVPYAFRAYARFGAEEIPVGYLLSEPADVSDLEYSGPYSSQRSGLIRSLGAWLVEMPAGSVQAIDLVLRPDPSLALRTVGMTSYYDGEIVIVVRGFQLDRPE